MEREEYVTWITTRRIKPGTYEDFRRAWRPSEFPAGMLRSFECFSPELKQVQSLDDFRAILAGNPQLFDVADVKYTSRSIDNGTAKFVGTVQVRAGGELPCDFTLRQYENGWKLIGWHIGQTE